MFQRILIASVTAFALMWGGFLSSTAEAHGPRVVSVGYGSGGHGHHHHHHNHHHHHVPVYRPPVCYPGVVPYGAGYSGGWQPYQYGGYAPVTRRPSFGFYLGF